MNPVVGPDTLIIAAHPDDEVLGAGGWMAKYPGCKVAILSEGTSAQRGPVSKRKPSTLQDVTDAMVYTTDRLVAKRQATKNALAGLSAEHVYEGSFPDQQLAVTNQDLHRVVTDLLAHYQPTTVLTHDPQELNADHRVVSEVVSVACRPFTAAGLRLQRLLAFSVDALPLAGPPVPPLGTIFCALSDLQMQDKIQALACYGAELRAWPHPRNQEAITAYHRWLGAVAGCEYAEPYTLLWGRV